MKNVGNKNPEIDTSAFEKTAVNKQTLETQTLVNALGINIEKQMTPTNLKLVQKIFDNARNGKLESKSQLEAKNYQRVDLISTKGGFALDKVLDKNGKIQWNATSIPTYVHNFLNKEVVVGPYEDNEVPNDDPNQKFALYIKE